MEPEVLTVAGFLDAPTCDAIRRAMDEGSMEPAEVLDAEIDLDEHVRRASQVEIAPEALARLESHLEAARERLERFYAGPLGEREGASVLRYRTGGFYRPHRDWGRVQSWPNAARRRVSLVLFLNSSRSVDPQGEFSGGALRLYASRAGVVDVHPRAGALVAFPATMVHEVTTVSDGVRDTAVDWYYGR